MTQNFAPYTARLGEFMARASAGAPALDDLVFNRLALELFALQFANNLPYRGLCEARRVTPASINHWGQIPAVPAAAFKELDLTSLPETERTTVFHSSGTTSQRPSRHFHNRASLAVYEASLLPWFRCHLFPELLASSPAVEAAFQTISLTPSPSAAPHSSLVHMFGVAAKAFGSASSFFAGRMDEHGAWMLDAEPLLDTLQQAHDPVVLLGTAFTFIQFIDRLAAQSIRLRLPLGSRALETGGYKGRSRSIPKADLHLIISERLSIALDHIVSEYGMSELSSQAYDTSVPLPHDPRPAPRAYRFPPWARFRIISPETGRDVSHGESGLIRVYDLANVRSVLAVQTEDLGVRHGEGFELTGRAAVAEPRGCSLMTA